MKKINEYGITLIALVVTIIILLILAGVTVGMATSGTGLFEKAKEATQKYQNAQEDEEIQIAKYSNEIDSYISGGRETSNFSLNEQAIGTYINNEILYQKTYYVENAENGITIDNSLNANNIEIRNIFGNAQVGANIWGFPASNTTWYGHLYIEEGKLKLATGTTISKLNITIQYTQK